MEMAISTKFLDVCKGKPEGEVKVQIQHAKTV